MTRRAYLNDTARRRPWAETLQLARRLRVPAICVRWGEVVDEYWPRGQRASQADDGGAQ